MIDQLPQMIPLSFCLECKGCCIFNEPKSPWRARLTQEEQTVYAKDQADRFQQDDFFLDAVSHQGGQHCCFLDVASHQCGVYDQRPLECALYPFLIMKRKNQLCLAVHLACPFVQKNQKSDEFITIEKAMKKIFLRKTWKNFLHRQHDRFQDLDSFRSEVDLLFYF
jgi:Fe-S-cluster containining protein